LSWSVDEVGRLQAQTTEANLIVWALPGGNTAADSVVYLATSRTPAAPNQALFGHSLSVRMDPSLNTQGIAIGKWISGLSVAVPARYPNVNQQIIFDRKADATTFDQVLEYDHAIDSWLGKWQVFSGRSYDVRSQAMFSSGLRWVVDCTEAFATGALQCSPNRVRYFRPLRREGDRIYGIEEFYSNQGALHSAGDDSPYVIQRSASRPNFHLCTNELCTSLATARTALPNATSRLRTYARNRLPSRGRTLCEK
jgi:hypothetical protein